MIAGDLGTQLQAVDARHADVRHQDIELRAVELGLGRTRVTAGHDGMAQILERASDRVSRLVVVLHYKDPCSHETESGMNPDESRPWRIVTLTSAGVYEEDTSKRATYENCVRGITPRPMARVLRGIPLFVALGPVSERSRLGGLGMPEALLRAARDLNQRREVGLDLVRIYLGVGLLVRGALFIARPEALLALIAARGDWFWPAAT